VPGDLDLRLVADRSAGEAGLLRRGGLALVLRGLRLRLEGDEEHDRAEEHHFTSGTARAAPAWSLSASIETEEGGAPCTTQRSSLRPPLPGRSHTSSWALPARSWAPEGSAIVTRTGRTACDRRPTTLMSGRSA